MQFGMFLEFGVRPGGDHATAFREGMRLVDDAEAWGVDAAWLSEFHFAGDRSVLSSPVVVAGAIAARTERMRIGSAIYVLPLTHPLRIAEEIATLDQLSNGRIDLGVGRSGFTNFYRGYGIDYAQSQARFDEAMAVLRAVWTGEPVAHKGQFYEIQCEPVVPRPVQQPHPPLRMAATRAETFGKVGHEGLPIFVGLRGEGLDELRDNLKAYRLAWTRAGHPGRGSAFLRIPVFAARDAALARSEARESIVYYFARQSRMVAKDAKTRTGASQDSSRTAMAARLGELSYEEILAHRVAFGSADELARRFAELGEVLDIDGIVGELNAGGMLSEASVRESLRIIANDVMPQLR
ncbi:MAG: LLM class flavin-dependent oxidoreductase [Gammaproteobacteria bacterium]|nr:LLM class flavin-dependent oxidoreductase [Gammaproteobacteria bacterium]